MPMSYPLIISFYTDDWKYPEYAKRMQKDCDDLGLECYIQELESKGGYLQNTCLKPKFILDCLLKFKRPILWLDVDTKIMTRPDALKGFSKDFAGCETPPSHFKDLYVSPLAFGYNNKTKKFIKKWVAATGAISDHTSFDEVWKSMGKSLDSTILPSEYANIMHRGTVPVTGCVFAIELSQSESKRKQMTELKRSRGY